MANDPSVHLELPTNNVVTLISVSSSVNDSAQQHIATTNVNSNYQEVETDIGNLNQQVTTPVVTSTENLYGSAEVMNGSYVHIKYSCYMVCMCKYSLVHAYTY